MCTPKAPQPIPYQGSKRRLVPILLRYVPPGVGTLYEPFAGSGALTIGAAAAGVTRRYVLGDTLAPLVELWRLLLTEPDRLCDGYERLWQAQLADPRAWYDRVRDEYNQDHEPAKLLYLLARCVKNAVRFNAEGRFNQSPDLRRLGMRPALLRARARQVHALLADRASAVHSDYANSLRLADPEDLVYMDPPYMGVSGGRDARYHQGLDYARFVSELQAANQREVSYMVSFDGRCGPRSYGPGLPEDLGLRRVEVPAGRSSQATLHGRAELTVESLYLSPALVERLGARVIAKDPFLGGLRGRID